MIPAKVSLSLAAVESMSAHAKAGGWGAESIPSEFHWMRQHTVNTKHKVVLTPEEVLSSPAALGEIDLTRDVADFLSWTAELLMARDGVLHGLTGWFDCELATGVWMTNSPLVKQAIDRPQAFLPIDQACATSERCGAWLTLSPRCALLAVRCSPSLSRSDFRCSSVAAVAVAAVAHSLAFAGSPPCVRRRGSPPPAHPFGSPL